MAVGGNLVRFVLNQDWECERGVAPNVGYCFKIGCEEKIDVLERTIDG